MLSSDVMRGFNDMLLLCLLYKKDSYGYELSKEITRISKGEYMMKETTLYAAFVRLEKKGFIDSYEGEESFGKKRTYFRITGLGQVYLKEKIWEWEETKKLINLFTDDLLSN